MKKMITRIMLCLTFSAFIATTQLHAQAITSEDIKTQMLKDWERAKGYSIDYLNAMPADKYSFKAVDSIRSFAEQMLHLAQANCFLMSTAVDQAPPAWMMSDPEHRSSAQNKDSVMYYVMASYDFCSSAVKTTDVKKWGEKKKVFNTYEETRFAMMNKTFEHQTHHRGQTTIYIRLLGIRPPGERLF